MEAVDMQEEAVRHKKVVREGYDRMATTYTSWNADKSSMRAKFLDYALDMLAEKQDADEKSIVSGHKQEKEEEEGEEEKGGERDEVEAGLNGASVLELGCGAGIPVLARLCTCSTRPRISRLVANDFSSAQIQLAREMCRERNFAGVEFMEGDMLELDLTFSSPSSLSSPPPPFDATGTTRDERDKASKAEREGRFDLIVSFFAIFHLPRDQQALLFTRVSQWLKPGGIFVFNLATLDAREIRGVFHGAEMFWSSFGVEENRRMIDRNGGLEILRDQVAASSEDLPVDDPDHGIEFYWVLARRKK